MKLLKLIWLLCFPFLVPAQQVLVAYYSQTGHTKAMAEAVAEGARQVKNCKVVLKMIDSVWTADLLAADAVIVGSPVYNANVAPPVQQFINRWPFKGSPMKDKIGATFVTGGGISAGEELVQINLLHSMLIFGMIVVGGESWQNAFGASAVTEEAPFKQGKGKVQEQFLKKARGLGRRVAEIAKHFAGRK